MGVIVPWYIFLVFDTAQCPMTPVVPPSNFVGRYYDCRMIICNALFLIKISMSIIQKVAKRLEYLGQLS